MTQIENPQIILDEWKTKYSLPGEVLWAGYKELGGSIKDGYRMGQCNYYKYVNSQNQWMPRSEIYLDIGMADAPQFFQMCTLWHEMAHARAYNEDGVSNDHDAMFRKYRRENTAYWLGDLLLKLIGGIWCRKAKDS